MESSRSVTLTELRERIRKFSDERNWEKFHSPKNLVMALSVEVSELMENFQWLTEQESEKHSLSPEQLQQVKDEIGDVLNYVLQLCDRLEIDPVQACAEKIEKNARKHPPK